MYRSFWWRCFQFLERPVNFLLLRIGHIHSQTYPTPWDIRGHTNTIHFQTNIHIPTHIPYDRTHISLESHGCAGAMRHQNCLIKGLKLPYKYPPHKPYYSSHKTPAFDSPGCTGATPQPLTYITIYLNPLVHWHRRADPLGSAKAMYHGNRSDLDPTLFLHQLRVPRLRGPHIS